MFLMYINELITMLANVGVEVKAFADDVKVYMKIVNDVDCNLLQRALDLLEQWADMWQLTISINKCVLNIGNSTLPVSMSINNNVLPQFSTVLDLGITVTSNLSPSIHICNIVSKANSRTIAIHQSFISRDITLLMRAYKTYVRPLIESNTVIWSPTAICDIELLERVQRKCTKKNCLVYKTFHILNGLNV